MRTSVREIIVRNDYESTEKIGPVCAIVFNNVVTIVAHASSSVRGVVNNLAHLALDIWGICLSAFFHFTFMYWLQK